MIKKIGFLALIGIVFYLIWWDINFDEYIQKIAEEKQFVFSDSENTQNHLKKIIINTIYRDYSRKIHQLAEQGITAPEGNFTVDVDLNVNLPDDFGLKVIDKKRSKIIVDVYSQNFMPLNNHELMTLTEPVVEDIMEYYRGIPKDPWGLRIEPINAPVKD